MSKVRKYKLFINTSSSNTINTTRYFVIIGSSSSLYTSLLTFRLIRNGLTFYYKSSLLSKPGIE